MCPFFYFLSLLLSQSVSCVNIENSNGVDFCKGACEGIIRDVASVGDDVEIVKPYVRYSRRKRQRNVNQVLSYEYEEALLNVEVGRWQLELEADGGFLEKAESKWIADDFSYHRSLKPCHYTRGAVKGEKSVAAITVCDEEVNGYIRTSAGAYFIQPLHVNDLHIIYRSKATPARRRKKRSPSESLNDPRWEFFNLTGDTFDIDGDSAIAEELHNNGNLSDVLARRDRPRNRWKEQIDSEEIGYFIDTAWETDLTTNHVRGTSFQSEPTRWLEIAIAVDHSVIGFHGRDRVEQYVLALMNIVSAIYQDASLEANMQLVVTRLLLYEHKRQTVVRPGNAKKSLENVNAWNRRLHISFAPGETHHDIAVWLTRSDIGGPSGYAPVNGVCDPKRSCALNRDEGLTSAFIIAHEMAHILGLTHDGDQKLGNDCGDEALEGSVMAPMVSATFHKFTWSECSRKEFKSKSSKWNCLQNSPSPYGTVLNATITAAFSMDEQCRMEFGEGFQLCRAFDIIEPCSHLWCGHVKSPLVCKTKKGPPLEGTECGFDKWCMNGYCEPVDRRRFSVPPVMNNPQDGEWGDWGSWGFCSRSCGRGVRFRSRICNNPEPAFGGKTCIGAAEEWEICNLDACPEPASDMRAQQCLNIIKVLKIQDRRANMTWLPYESDHMEMKCQLICMSKETRELFVTGENLIDGTPCSYETSSDICIQGTCQVLGCDGELFSKIKEDFCGVCGGNNSKCSNSSNIFHKRIKKEVSRIAVIPRLARHIDVEVNLTIYSVDNPTAALILKNRMKKKYAIPIPNSGIYAEIIEGTKFYYKKAKGSHKIWATGPLLVELVVLLYAPKSEVNLGLNITTQLEYFIKKDFLNNSTRFSWVLGGWGSCSASCGGGKRHKTVACWDPLFKKIVRRKFCSLITKPAVPTEPCNNYSCNFHWITGEWEPCSATCGSYGTQSRELYCVPQSVMSDLNNNFNGTKMEAPWKFMVSPIKCAGLRPISVRPCYRIPCPSYWEYGDWSECSASCGSGIATRTTRCPPPEGETFYTCGIHPPTPRRICRGAFTRRTNPLCKRKKRKRCTGDQSKYCSLPTLLKYCKLGSFKRLCCKACTTFTLYPFSV